MQPEKTKIRQTSGSFLMTVPRKERSPPINRRTTYAEQATSGFK